MSVVRVGGALRRVVSSCWVSLRYRRVVNLGQDVKFIGVPVVRCPPGANLTIGPRTVLISSGRGNSLRVPGRCWLSLLRPGASIVIGADCGITSASIASAVGVVLGDRVLLGAGVTITDSDHHPVKVWPVEDRRYAETPLGNPADRVSIGNDVFIGAGCFILKGVTIGRGSVIGAGSVVASDVPPHAVAAGNPCRVVGSIVSD